VCFALSQSESATKRHLVNSVKGTGPFCLFSLDCGRCSGFGKGAVLHIDGTNRKCIYNRSFEGKETWHGEHFAVNFSIRGYFPNWRARVIITTKTISQAKTKSLYSVFPCYHSFTYDLSVSFGFYLASNSIAAVVCVCLHENVSK